MGAAVSHSANSPALVWFRNDLRLADNPALTAGVKSGRPVICLYVLDDETPGAWRIGGAQRWWLHHSLTSLSRDLAALGGRLVLQCGRGDAIVQAIVEAERVAEVHWNRSYEPFAITRDTALKQALKAIGVTAHSHNGALLFEPWEIETGSGGPYRVFTPFWRACRAAGLPRQTLAAPQSVCAPKAQPRSDHLDDWALLPIKPDWAGGLRETWAVGESAAHERLSAFLDEGLAGYGERRDLPGVRGTSRLSPHLRWGEISPRHVVSQTLEHMAARGIEAGGDTFLSEIGWREFSYSLLYHNPSCPEDNLQTKFDVFPWREDEAHLRAWRRGETGYPIVDAGMRELYATGWMHNRVRMIVGSFLVKHLLQHWRAGEDWFWDCLVDADLASNAAGWQWIAGTGADAAPYFRIFNPTAQGEKFDADGAYVRRWVPELAKLPDRLVHEPAKARASELEAVGVRLGRDYPAPIVEHRAARERALAAFQSLKAAA